VSGAGAPAPRVLHVGKFYPPHMGGIETHLHALCTELRGFVDVRVLVANEDRNTVREIADGVPVTRLGTLFNIAAAPINAGLARSIRDSGARIVHAHLPHPAATIACLASRHRGAFVATYHSDIVRQRIMGAAYTPVLHRFLSRCSAIIATSPNYARSSRVLARHQDRLRVIPLGIRPERFDDVDGAQVAEIRRRHGEKIVLSVGRLIYYKGFEHLIDAMRLVDARLLIVGEGPLRDALGARVRAAGVGERVRFLGEIRDRDLVAHYHAADVFALASTARSEAFGLVQLEAMACGRPVVNTALGSGVPYVSVHGQTGLTVPPSNAAALASALDRLLGDADLRRRFGEAGRARVRAEFSLDAVVARTLDLYRELEPEAFGQDAGHRAAPTRIARTS